MEPGSRTAFVTPRFVSLTALTARKACWAPDRYPSQNTIVPIATMSAISMARRPRCRTACQVETNTALSSRRNRPNSVFLGTEVGEQQDLPDRFLAGQQHHQPVNPDAQPGVGGQPQLEGPKVGLVDRHGLLV